MITTGNTQPDEEKAMVPMPPSGRGIVQEQEGNLLAKWSETTPTYVTNLDVSTPTGRAMLTQALAKATRKTRNMVGQRIEAIGFVVHEATVADSATGEYAIRLRGAIIDESGIVCSTMSGPVLSTLCALAKARGKGKWDPPSILEIREWPLEEGKSYCDMIEIAPEPPVITTRKK